jgi:hypothetical protein
MERYMYIYIYTHTFIYIYRYIIHFVSKEMCDCFSISFLLFGWTWIKQNVMGTAKE